MFSHLRSIFKFISFSIDAVAEREKCTMGDLQKERAEKCDNGNVAQEERRDTEVKKKGWERDRV